MCAVYTMKVNDDYWLTVYNLHPLKRFIMSSPTDAVKKWTKSAGASHTGKETQAELKLKERTFWPSRERRSCSSSMAIKGTSRCSEEHGLLCVSQKLELRPDPNRPLLSSSPYTSPPACLPPSHLLPHLSPFLPPPGYRLSVIWLAPWRLTPCGLHDPPPPYLWLSQSCCWTTKGSLTCAQRTHSFPGTWKTR